eukprot:m.5268 g.5268  ORF g.5268 m.5268 type:complete len:136 (+) comp7537_c0_seq1:581-988(+)
MAGKFGFSLLIALFFCEQAQSINITIENLRYDNVSRPESAIEWLEGDLEYYFYLEITKTWTSEVIETPEGVNITWDDVVTFTGVTSSDEYLYVNVYDQDTGPDDEIFFAAVPLPKKRRSLPFRREMCFFFSNGSI